MSSRRWDLNPGTQDRKQIFAVLMLPLGTSAHTARPEAFKRIRVVARDDLDARHSAEVAAVRDHHVVEVLVDGAESEAMTRARIAAASGDEVASDLRGANNAPATGPTFPTPRAG